MTTVAAVARGGVVAMAADSMINIYDRPASIRKIVRMRVGERRPYGEILLGVSGDGALPGLLEADLRVADQPNPSDETSVQAWATTVARAVTDISVQARLVDDGRMDSTLLLGWSGRLWTISHMLAVFHADGVAAVGSGEGPAIGAADLLLDGGADPAQAVTGALSVAIARDRHSGGPIHVQVLEPPDG